MENLIGSTKFWCLTPAAIPNTIYILLISAIFVFAVTFIMILNARKTTASIDGINRRNKLEK
ncbi:4319_t:CDS:2 [Funneliformis caledonium]|uniref:4319_t:CDS:1 n=1 Tax=Funneliformis caledonium TaxID=1117310 RepID=A0A9N9D6X8_9GLOM|nr:4319_t:CDS:2 [Funneliformis caledonium]